MCLFLLLEQDPIQQGAKALADSRTPLIVAALGLLGTLFPIFLSWLQTRGADTRRSRQVDESMKRIEFWKQWLSLSIELGAPAADQARQRVQHELDMLCSSLSVSAAEVHTEAVVLRGLQANLKSKLTQLSSFRRLFVLYKPPQALAWVPRIIFYSFFCFGCIGMMVEVSEYITHRGDPFGVFFSLFLFGVGFAFRTLSIYVEKPRQGTTSHTDSSPI